MLISKPDLDRTQTPGGIKAGAGAVLAGISCVWGQGWGAIDASEQAGAMAPHTAVDAAAAADTSGSRQTAMDGEQALVSA